MFLHARRGHSSLTLAALLSLLGASGAFAQADLTISASLEPGDDVAESGDRITIEYRVSNRGNREVNDPRVGFYLSDDAGFDGGDTFIEADNISDLDAGESDDENEQVTVPNVPDGEYFLLGVVDDLDRIAESDESNNVAAMPITIGEGGGGGGLPDLAVPSSQIESRRIEEDGQETLIVDYVVRNFGEASAPRPRLGIYLSEDDVLSEDDEFLRSDRADAVRAGGSVREDAFVDIPSDLPPGDYFLLFFVDYQDAVEEEDESNNVGALAFTVEEPTEPDGPTVTDADLDVRYVRIPRNQRWRTYGQTFDVRHQIRNVGTEDAPSYDVGYYLVPRSDTRNWIPLRIKDRSALGAGRRASWITSFYVGPNLDPGIYYMVVVADDSERLTEPDEWNNYNWQTMGIYP